MTLRRRIALFLDPDLRQPDVASPLRLDLYRSDHGLSAEMREVVMVLKDISRKIERRPRIIECAHPELHPVDDPFDETDFPRWTSDADRADVAS